ncbi:MAG: hypothetical protein WD989_01150 [Candidatus Paceibacterota bacterium]
MSLKKNTTRNRGVPTLSLKGIVGLCLFFVFLQLIFCQSAYAQNLKNRTEEMWPFETVIISSESLPDKVYDAQKDKIIVMVICFEKGTNNVLFASSGTGFIGEQPGIIITTRHLFIDIKEEADRLKSEIIKSGRTNFDYDCSFVGRIITSTDWLHFPLNLVAMGEAGTFKDVMALRIDQKTWEKAINNQANTIFENPFRMLMRTSKYADGDVGDKVYITGFAPITGELSDKNWEKEPISMDIINWTFPAEIDAKITDEAPFNKTGVKLFYRLRDSAEPGFSGGKVLNNEGQIVGMVIATSQSKNFVYVFSSKDIKKFLKDNNLK